MEDALRENKLKLETVTYFTVLILVLMEDALRVYYVSGNQFDAMTVLILVLMEDALRELESITA